MRAIAMAVLTPLAIFWNDTCGDEKSVDDAGRDLYATHCASCHGEDATGNGPRAGDLAIAPPDLTQLVANYGSPIPVEALSEFVDGRSDTHGGREMPVFGDDFFAGESPNPDRESGKRIAIGLILGHLETLQRPRIEK